MSLVHHWPSWERARQEYGSIDRPTLLMYGQHDWSRPESTRQTGAPCLGPPCERWPTPGTSCHWMRPRSCPTRCSSLPADAAPPVKPGLGPGQGHRLPGSHAGKARMHAPKWAADRLIAGRVPLLLLPAARTATDAPHPYPQARNIPVDHQVRAACDAPTSMVRYRRTNVELDGTTEASAIAGTMCRELSPPVARRVFQRLGLPSPSSMSKFTSPGFGVGRAGAVTPVTIRALEVEHTCPHPSEAALERSAATTSPGASVRSRITCQRAGA
jgi:hypothetical protein